MTQSDTVLRNCTKVRISFHRPTGTRTEEIFLVDPTDLINQSVQDWMMGKSLLMGHRKLFDGELSSPVTFGPVFTDVSFYSVSLHKYKGIYVNLAFEDDEISDEPNPMLKERIRDSKSVVLSVRTKRILFVQAIFTLADLVQLSKNDLLKLPDLGRKSVTEIEEMLAQHNLKLRS